MADLQARLEFLFQTKGAEAVMTAMSQIESASMRAGTAIFTNIGNALDNLGRQARQASVNLEKGLNVREGVKQLELLRTSLERIRALYGKKVKRTGLIDPAAEKKILQTSQAIRVMEKNLTRLTSAAVKGAGGNLKLVDSAHKVGKAYDRAGNSVRSATTAARGFNSGQKTLTTTLESAIGKLIQYRLSYLILRKAMEAIRGSVEIFTEINTELAQLEKVVNPLNTSLEKLKTSAFELGKEFAVSASSVLKAFNIWARVGLEQNEIIEATRTTLIGVNAIGLNTVAMTEALTSVIFTYGIEVENTTQIVNEWLRVQSKFPVAARDLANALKAVGSSAKELGADLTELGGFVTAVNAITRKSGTAIGQSLKTIFARIPKDESIKAFKDIGIAVRKSATEFRDIDDILDELAGKWNKLTQVQKTNIAQTVGGIRRYVDFLALMDAYDIKQQAIIEGTLATDEALRASNIEIDTFAKQMELLNIIASEVAEGFGGELANSIKGFVSLLANVLSGIREVQGPLSFIVRGLLAFGAGVAVVKISVLAFNLALSLTRKALAANAVTISASTASYRAYTGGVVGATAVTYGFTGALTAVKAALGPVAIAIGAFSALVALIPSLFTKSEGAIANFTKASNFDVSATKKRIAALKTQNEFLKTSGEKFTDLVIQYKNMKDAGEDISDVLNKINIKGKALSSVNNELSASIAIINSHLDDSDVSFDKYDKSIDKTIDKNEDLIKSSERLLEAQRNLFEATFAGRQTALENAILSITEASDTVVQGLKDARTSLDAFFASEENIANLRTKGVEFGFNISIAEQVAKEEAKRIRFLLIDRLGEDITDDENTSIENWFNTVSAAIETNIGKIRPLGQLITTQNVDEFIIALENIRSGLSVLPGISGVELAELEEKLKALREEWQKFQETSTDDTSLDTSFFDLLKGDIETLENRLQKAQAKMFLGDEIAKQIIDFNNTIGAGLSETNKNVASNFKGLVNLGQKAINELALMDKGLESEAKLAKDRLQKLLKEGLITELEFKADIKGVEDGLKEALIVVDELRQSMGPSLQTELDINIKKLKEINDIIFQEASLRKQVLLSAGLLKNETNQLVSVMKKAGREEEDILRLKLNSLKVETDINLAALGVIDNNTKRLKAQDIMIKFLKEEQKLGLQLASIDYVENIEQAAAAAKQFQSALSDTFSSIPELTTENHERRKELTKEIKEVEQELAAARIDGEQKAIVETENRLKKLKEELEGIKPFFDALAQSLNDLFINIKTNIFDALAQDFSEKLLKITIGEGTLGDEIGAAIAGVNKENIENLKVLYDNYTEVQIIIFKEFLASLGIIMDANVANDFAQNVKSQVKTLSIGSEISDGADKLNDALKSGGRLAAALIGDALIQGFVQGKRSGALPGARIGQVVGAGAGNKFLEEVLGDFAFLGGPLGSIFGGLLGGAIGGLFGKKEEDLPEVPLQAAVVENTFSINANTDAIKNLTSAMFNAPSTFIQPAFSTQGAARRISITINANDANDVANKVRDIMDGDYEESFRATGTTGRYDI